MSKCLGIANDVPVFEDSYVYFVGADTGPVKIGRSTDPEARLCTLQTGNPLKLRILATFSEWTISEQEVHDLIALRQERVAGEWFERDAALQVMLFFVQLAGGKHHDHRP